MMMFVLMAVLLVGAITVTAIQIIGTDVLGSVKEVEADQVYNIAQAGVHYAIGQLLQPNGASTGDHYTTGTLTLTSGSTTLGTATITVNCVDTTSSNGWAPPCASSAYPGYRRIISTGSLPVSGPSRTIVAVVQGTSSGGGGGGTYTFCSTGSIVDKTASGDTTTIYADIASNTSINMTPSGGVVSVLGDTNTPQQYTGKLISNGSVTCGTGCSAAGGLFPNQSGTLCTFPAPPTSYSPGSSDLPIAAGTTYLMNSTTGYSFRNITMNAGSSSAYTTLQIQADISNPNAVTTVQINSIYMGYYTRVMILGVGKVQLMIGTSTATGLAIDSHHTHFGVASTDTPSTVVPVAASQFIVWVNSNGTAPGSPAGTCSTVGCCEDSTTSCAAFVSHVAGGATIYVPNGLEQVDDSSSQSVFNTASMAKQFVFTGLGTIKSDTSGLSGGGSTTYSNFNQLMSWKDQ